MNISQEALEFLRESYKDVIQSFLDDPDEQFISWTPQDFAEWYQKMARIGNEIGISFWDAKGSATDFEIKRAEEMLKLAGIKNE